MAEQYASFAMYPFEALRPAWARLWDAVHARAPWTPAALRWSGSVHEHWRDPACRVAHACGWPVATALHDHVTVVGAFELALDDAVGHSYHSVIVSSTSEPVEGRDAASLTAAANSDDSLSGWISLVAALGASEEAASVAVRWTGSHVESLAAVRDGAADIAAIDAVTWRHVVRLHPELTTGLHEVGRGPLVPSPPVVVPAATTPDSLTDLRVALAEAIDDSLVDGHAAALLITGFAPVDDEEYAGLRALASWR